MAKEQKPVMGVIAPRAKGTLAGAFWLATLLSIPVFLILTGGELLWRWLAG